jgi:hypothetical protein
LIRLAPPTTDVTNARRCVALGVVVVLVAVAGCSGAGGESPGDTATETLSGTPTATQTPTVTPTATATATQTPTAAAPEQGALGLGFEIRNSSECGNACRDVTYAVVDTGGDGAGDVSAEIEITADGEPVWNGTESVGAVPAGGETVRTVRVEVGLSEAYAVSENDDRVTVTTVLAAGDRATTIEQERQF